jgi:hypothetical protein
MHSKLFRLLIGAIAQQLIDLFLHFLLELIMFLWISFYDNSRRQRKIVIISYQRANVLSIICNNQCTNQENYIVLPTHPENLDGKG